MLLAVADQDDHIEVALGGGRALRIQRSIWPDDMLWKSSLIGKDWARKRRTLAGVRPMPSWLTISRCFSFGMLLENFAISRRGVSCWARRPIRE